MSEKPIHTGFTLDLDTLDALRMEVQGVSPETQKEFMETVAEAHQFFLAGMKRYITKPLSTEEIQQRFMLLDADTFQTFQEEWEKPPERTEAWEATIGRQVAEKFSAYLDHKNVGIDKATNDHLEAWLKTIPVAEADEYHEFLHSKDKRGRYVYGSEHSQAVARAYTETGKMVVAIQEDGWNILSVASQEYLVKHTGSVEAAKKLAQKAKNLQVILHEMTHLYQTPNDGTPVPLWFLELQATWASQMLLPEELRMFDQITLDRTEFFQTLLDKLNKHDIHAVGIHENRGYNLAALYQANKMFTPDVQQKLYPDYRLVE